tara:strand:+ start:101 stop:2254 length:2154 start_codon:yes stop_codon:yes gene_type:complete
MAKKIEVALTLNSNQFDRNIAKSEKNVDKFSKNSSSGIGKVGAALAALGAGAAIRGIVATGAAFQDLQNSLNVVFGGVEQGADAFKRVEEFAASTQFSVQTLTGAFIQLKGAGIEPTDRLLQTFADTASVSTDQAGTLTAALDLLTRTTDGGLGIVDLQRLQDRGVPVFAILKKEIGKSRSELSEFGKTAAGAKTITDGLIAGLNKRFGGALATQVGLINFELNQLGDATDKFQKALFDTFSEDAATGIQGLTSAINKLAENIDGLLQIGKGLAQMFAVATLVFPFARALRVASTAMFSLQKGTSLFAAGGGTFMAIVTKLGGGIKAFLIAPFMAAGKAISRLFKPAGGTDILSGLGRLKLASQKVGEGLLWIGGAVTGIKGLQNAMEGASSVANGFAEKMGPPRKLFDDEQLKQYMELTDNDTLFDIDAAAPAKTLTALEEFAKKIDDSTGGLDEYNRLMTLFNEMFTDPKTVAEMETRQKALDDLTGSYSSLFDPLEALNDEISDGIEDLAEYNTLQAELNRLAEQGIYTTQELADAKRDLDEAFGETAQMQSFIDTLSSATDTLANDLASAFTEGKNAMESFKGFFKTLVQQIIADAIKLLMIIPILQMLGFTTAGGSITGLSGTGLMGVFKQTGAGGGNLMPNRPVLVGESGKEIFTPASSGSLQPAAGGQNITYNINAIDVQSFQSMIARDKNFIHAVVSKAANDLPSGRRF